MPLCPLGARSMRRIVGLAALIAALSLAGCTTSSNSSVPTAPNLSGAVEPQGAFNPNEVGAKYEKIIISNAPGAAATSGAVTVTDPDINFTVTSIAGGNGSNWACTFATLSCTRSDSLAGGSSYDPIFVIGNVTAGAGQSASIGFTLAYNGTTLPASSPTSVPILTPLTMTKAFNPTAIGNLNANSALTFTITNPGANAVAQTGVGFTDPLPSGLVVAATPGVTNTCGTGSTVTATAGAATISLSSGTVGVNTNCTLTVNVTGTAVGTTITNTSGLVNSTNGGTQTTAPASATISVAAPPTISKAFGAASVPLNGSTSLTLTVTNPTAPTANTFGLTGVAFTDALPAGLAVATPNGLVDNCGGTATATAGSGSVSLTGGTAAQGGNCTVIVNVTGTTAGAKSNTANGISSTQSGPTAATSNTAILDVEAPPAITKAFGATGMTVGSSTSLTFTLSNPAVNAVAQVGKVAFSDADDQVCDSPGALVDNCGGTATAVAGATTISLTGGAIGINTNCTIAVNVTATAAGVFTNTTAAISSTNGGTGATAIRPR